jgi:hypothetical protein
MKASDEAAQQVEEGLCAEEEHDERSEDTSREGHNGRGLHFVEG